MIAIIDYGLGNIKAFANVYNKLGVPFKIAKTSSDFDNIEKLILPGVGAFDQAMEKLNNSGMRDRITKLVTINKIPVLGICVGMQILAKSSEEGVLPGLGWIDSEVKIFDKLTIHSITKLPHMGWNNVSTVAHNPLFDGLVNMSRFYFLHSYYFACNNQNDEIAFSEYGTSFCCAINHENIYGVQFHPEKSHHSGVKILENFSKL